MCKYIIGESEMAKKKLLTEVSNAGRCPYCGARVDRIAETNKVTKIKKVIMRCSQCGRDPLR